MTRTAVLFPGQGAQFVGMSADLVDRCPETKRFFDAAREVSGHDVWEITTAGPEELLNSTELSQPAIFTVSCAAIHALRAAGGGRIGDATATAGLSLGEYSALVFADALDFESALEIVVRRGRAMQAACDVEPSGMTSLLGLTLDEARGVVDAVGQDHGVLGVANVNSEKQIVLSGALPALEIAGERAKEAGARRVVPLKVAGAYHSKLMASATEELRPLLENAKIEKPRIDFYPNVSAEKTDDPETIRAGLLSQIESSVLWEPTLQFGRRDHLHGRGDLAG